MTKHSEYIARLQVCRQIYEYDDEYDDDDHDDEYDEYYGDCYEYDDDDDGVDDQSFQSSHFNESDAIIMLHTSADEIHPDVAGTYNNIAIVYNNQGL